MYLTGSKRAGALTVTSLEAVTSIEHVYWRMVTEWRAIVTSYQQVAPSYVLNNPHSLQHWNNCRDAILNGTFETYLTDRTFYWRRSDWYFIPDNVQLTAETGRLSVLITPALMVQYFEAAGLMLNRAPTDTTPVPPGLFTNISAPIAPTE